MFTNFGIFTEIHRQSCIYFLVSCISRGTMFVCCFLCYRLLSAIVVVLQAPCCKSNNRFIDSFLHFHMLEPLTAVVSILSTYPSAKAILIIGHLH